MELYYQSQKIIDYFLTVPKKKKYFTDKERGVYVPKTRITIADWMNTWFRDYGFPKWREGTRATNRRIIDLHIIPQLGVYKLQDLRPEHIQRFLNYMINLPVREGHDGSATVKRRMAVLRAALKQAADNDLIPKNPADKIKDPQVHMKETHALTDAEHAALLDALPDTTNGRAIRFALSTGLRGEELYGLVWGDIADDMMNIRRTCQYLITVDANGKRSDKAELVIGLPKSDRSRRPVPLNSTALMVLNEQLKAQRIQRMKAGSAWDNAPHGKHSIGNNENWIFATTIGTATDRNNIDRTLRTALQKAECGVSVGLHALRHTFGTNVYNNTCDVKAVSALMGHADESFTTRTYIHTNADRTRAAVSTIDRSNK